MVVEFPLLPSLLSVTEDEKILLAGMNYGNFSNKGQLQENHLWVDDFLPRFDKVHITSRHVAYSSFFILILYI